MPLKVLRIRPQDGVFVEVKRLLVKTREEAAMR